VNATRVNVREGPSTEFAVIDSVAFGVAMEILTDPDEEWVKIRIQGDGVEGYIARRFLQNSEPNG
jgi:SH3-like domain-containing protein